MKKLVLFLGLCLWSFAAVAEKMTIAEISDAEYYQHIKESVKKFQDLIKTNNPQLIAQNVVYPYSLGWGVPSVHNKQEFVEKYDIILPEHLREYLINSPMDDWGSGENLGGICLNDCPDAHLTDDGKILSIKKSEELKNIVRNILQKKNKLSTRV